MASPPQSTATSSRLAAKSQRVLACVLCQQRKVKCDRHFPCSNCVKASARCVPATLMPRKRRRKLPEAESKLLDRIRHYEALLRDNNITFEPYHSDPSAEQAAETSHGPPEDTTTQGGSPQPLTRRSDTFREEGTRYGDFRSAVDEWFEDTESHDAPSPNNSQDEHTHSMKSTFSVRRAWNNRRAGSNNILFGFHQTNLDLSAMHPNQVQIFRLWQLYLDNVNPVLKVTHTPTLQPRIIDAAGNVTRIEPNLRALMFSIYCISIVSLTDEQCLSQFGSDRSDLLAGYQLATQQALIDCKFLSTENRDCLTALVLYLMSVRSDADPRALASILGIGLRIAERMGIQTEAITAKHNVVEAELRRRLWWALISFDRRSQEIAGYRVKLSGTGDCKPPLNVNDFDLRPEMLSPPEAHRTPTEALFVVVRSDVADRFIEFMSQPGDKLGASAPSADTVTEALERELEENYFQFCNPENPLHYMTIWGIKGAICKFRLMMRYAMKPSEQSEAEKQAQRDRAFADAIHALECDTKLTASPLTKGFNWYLNMYFPFPAYIHLVQELRERPLGEHAEKTWQVMSDNVAARINDMRTSDDGVVKLFAKRILQAWEIREAALGAMPNPGPLYIPPLVSEFRSFLAQHGSSMSTPSNTAVSTGGALPNHPDSSFTAATSSNTTLSAASGLPTPSSSGFDAATAMQFNPTGPDMFSNGSFGDPMMDFSPMGSMNWNVAFWNQMNTPTWW